MRTFELCDSDFWGKRPERMTYELDEGVIALFVESINHTISSLADIVREGFTGRNLYKTTTINKRNVFSRVVVSSQMETAVFEFRTAKSSGANVGAFYAYCMCAMLDRFGSVGTAVMGNDQGYQRVEIALQPEVATILLDYIRQYSGRQWIDNAA